jgi:predicted nuclease of predicted toxin-antitoxin system
VKFLIDHNLSPKLVLHLKDRFPGSVHTFDLGFDRTPDQDLWKFAAEHGFHILTKDTDYEQLSMLRGAPPKVVWLRIGNAPTSTVRSILDKYQAEIVDFLLDDERTLLALSNA